MNLTKDWYYNLVDALKPFSNKEYQLQVWLKGEGDKVSSFIEASCQLFDDTALSYYLEDSNKIIVSNKCDKILHEISSLIEAIDEKQSANEIIENQNMVKIRELSSNAIILIEKYIKEMK